MSEEEFSAELQNSIVSVSNLTNEEGKAQLQGSDGKTLNVSLLYFVNYAEKPLCGASVEIVNRNGSVYLKVIVPHAFYKYDVLVNVKENLCGIIAIDMPVLLVDEWYCIERNLVPTDSNGDAYFATLPFTSLTDEEGKADVCFFASKFNIKLTCSGENDVENPIQKATIHFLYDGYILVFLPTTLGLEPVHVNVEVTQGDVTLQDWKVAFLCNEREGYLDVIKLDELGNAHFEYNPQLGFTKFNGFVQVSAYNDADKILNVAVNAVNSNNNTSPLEFAKVQVNSDESVSFTLPRHINVLNDIQINVKEKVGGIGANDRRVFLFDEGKDTPRNATFPDELGDATFNHPKTFKLSFSPNGGSGSMEDQLIELKVDDPTLHPNAFTKSGVYCNFDRWNTKPDGTGISFKNSYVFTGDEAIDTETVLYAIWTPAYWLAPSFSDDEVDNNYECPTFHITKTSSEINADVKSIKGNSNDVVQEYKEYMLSDNVHFYTKIGNGISKSDYACFRIVNVGSHKATGGESLDKPVADESTLTFQSVCQLPLSYKMNSTNTNVGGWPGSELRAKMSENGEIYNLFNEGFTEAILPVTKFCACPTNQNSETDTEIVSTKDKFWLMSFSEMFKLERLPWDVSVLEKEGEMYQFWARGFQDTMNAIDTFQANKPLNKFLWLRSSYSSNSTSFFALSLGEEVDFQLQPIPAFVDVSVSLCFAF